MAGFDSSAAMIAFTKAVEDSTKALKGFAKGVGKGGGFGGADTAIGRGRGGSGAGGAAEEGVSVSGALLGLANGALSRGVGGAAAAASAVGAAAISAAGAGLITQQRGGDFGAGAIGQLNQIVGALPFVGEFSGISGANRAEASAAGRLNALTDPIAQFGGDASAIKDALGPVFLDQQNRVELNHQDTAIVLNEGRQASGLPSITPSDVSAAADVFFLLNSPLASTDALDRILSRIGLNINDLGAGQ